MARSHVFTRLRILWVRKSGRCWAVPGSHLRARQAGPRRLMGQAGDAGGGGGPAEALGWGIVLWPLHVAGASLQPTWWPQVPQTPLLPVPNAWTATQKHVVSPNPASDPRGHASALFFWSKKSRACPGSEQGCTFHLLVGACFKADTGHKEPPQMWTAVCTGPHSGWLGPCLPSRAHTRLLQEDGSLEEGLGEDLGQEDPLEEEMATGSSILFWRIPWTEEPGGLQSTGSQRVGHA